MNAHRFFAANSSSMQARHDAPSRGFFAPRLASAAAAVTAAAIGVWIVAMTAGCTSSGGYEANHSLDDEFPARHPAASADAVSPSANNASTANNEAEHSAQPTLETTPSQPQAVVVETEVSPEVEAHVQALVLELSAGATAAPDSTARQAATQAENRLVLMGPGIVPVLEKLSDVSNALAISSVIARIKVNQSPDWHTDPPPPTRNPTETTAEPGTTATSPSAPAAHSAGGGGNWRPEDVYAALVGQQIVESSLDSAAVGRFIVAKLREMEVAADRQNYPRAIAIGEAILTLVPDTSFARQIGTRLERFRELQTQQVLLDGRIVAVQPEITYGQPLTFRVVLRNVSSKQLTVVFTHVDARSRMRDDLYHSPCVLRVKFTQWADARTPIESVRSEFLKAEGSVTLKPGDVWSMEWTLQAAQMGEQLRAIGEFEVAGTIRPIAVESIDGPENVRTISCAPATARVLPATYQSAKSDPVGELRAALARQEEVGIVVAATAARTAPMDVRKRVVSILIDNLSHRGRAVRQAVFLALTAVTGYNLANENHWRTWYEANKHKPDLGLDGR